MNDFAIQTKHLSRSFDSKTGLGLIKAVDDLSLDVKKGEIFGLIGPDGAGKSTTMRLLTYVLKADHGSILMDGVDISKNSDEVRRRIGYMPQKFSLYGDLTVGENMKFFADLYGVTGHVFARRRDELLNFSRLGSHIKKLARSLSGGMQKKLALSCNLFHTPKILILDEPTNGVDPVSRRELWGLLYALLAEGTTILVSTPYMDEAERCTRIALLYNGKLLACDTPVSFIKNDTAQSSFEEAFIDLIKKQQQGAL